MPPFSRRGSGGTTVTVTLGGGGGGGGGLISKKKATAGGVRGGPTRARACAPGPALPHGACVRLPRAARRGACDGARVLTADGALALPVPRVRRPGSCRPR
jgi:hypothetical protein